MSAGKKEQRLEEKYSLLAGPFPRLGNLLRCTDVEPLLE
jgi:hypothetical protein